ncbi:hypothetical protein B7494_g6310 [Chlorociboria aeruginascens]|nr:hypothetical protein B7494_g6310 [Chlorociboria aeruginascens]
MEKKGPQCHIAIIGSGFAGLCLAIGLRSHGISVQVYEASPTIPEVGAGITISVNGVRAMGKLHPKIESAFLQNATSNGIGSKRSLFWDCRNGMSDDAKLIRPVEGKAYQSIHRAKFLSLLADILPPEVVHFNKRLVSLKQDASGVRISFADGSEAVADALVGADGVRSSVRQFMNTHDEGQKIDPHYSGIYTYRGLVPMDKVVAEIGRELAMTAQNYVGNDAHIITYPIEKGTILNVAACKRDIRTEWLHERWQIPASREGMLEDFSGFGEPARKIISLVETTDKWGGFDLPTPLPPFYNEKIVIIGDAAHAPTPHQGAGGSQAIEDSYVLSNLIGRVYDITNIPAAFRAFDAVRRARTERIISTSRDAAEIYQLRSLGLEDVGPALGGRYDWIWDIDLDAHLAEAIGDYERMK